MLVVSFLRNGGVVPQINNDQLKQMFELEMKYWGLQVPLTKFVDIFS